MEGEGKVQEQEETAWNCRSWARTAGSGSGSGLCIQLVAWASVFTLHFKPPALSPACLGLGPPCCSQQPSRTTSAHPFSSPTALLPHRRQVPASSGDGGPALLPCRSRLGLGAVCTGPRGAGRQGMCLPGLRRGLLRGRGSPLRAESQRQSMLTRWTRGRGHCRQEAEPQVGPGPRVVRAEGVPGHVRGPFTPPTRGCPESG